ncbi:PhnB protein [Bacillus pakistanensis]|uniref:PhnB protein n=1 Tax=Rossellomorea pakistanensis TaxID=992288 RepID=A0ABS2NE61_9BACI|nr:VOC family protein [Bacillus pakistanensis]MBM7586142.1 PhnB protein [Bacillus pakistanensis]
MKHQATPYLIFDGIALEALEYYHDVFQGEILNVQTFGDADYPTPPEMDDKIMHAQFKKEELFIMMSDSFQDQSVTVGNNISLALEFESSEEIQKIYDQLKEKGSVLMELQDTFWGATYAKVEDPFGITWDLNYTKENNR